MPLDLLIDCGGTGDNYYSPSLTFNFGVADTSGLTDAPTGAQIGTTRYANTGETLTYGIPVTAGKTYRVRLYFSETDGVTGTRVMNIDINGVRKASNYAPYVAAGNVLHKAVVLDYTIVCPTPTLQIDFISVSIQPVCGAIRIQEIDTTPPTKVENLVFDVLTETSVKLDWQAATDNYAVTDYQIQRSTAADFSGASVTTSGGATTKTLTGLTTGATYYFRVRASDGVNFGAWSNAAQVFVSTLEVVTFAAKRPLDVQFVESYTIFEPIEGDEDIAEDKPIKRIFSINSLYTSKISRADLWDFLNAHRLRQKFIWHNEDRSEYVTVKIIKLSSEKELRASGEFEFVLREV